MAEIAEQAVLDAKAALAAAEQAAQNAKGTGVANVVAATKAVAAAKKELAAAEAGVVTAGKTRKDVLAEQRVADFAAKAETRAQAEIENPVGEGTIRPFDIQNRPAAPPADDNFIYYYSWIGGATTGEWTLYRAPNTPENMGAYGSRAVGGRTKAEYGISGKGAQALKFQPQPIKNDLGQIIGWTTPEGGTSPTGGTGAGTGGAGAGAGASGTGGAGGTGGTGGAGTGGMGTGGAGFGGIGGTGGTGGTGLGTGFTAGGISTNPFTPGSAAATAWNERKSAYDLLFSEFSKYGLQSLVAPLQGLVQEGVSPSEFTIQLRNTPAYKQRFGANQARIQKGLRALNEAEYIGLEDQYQNIMRQYGLPASYYARGDMGRQEGFEKFIAGDVSPVELEQRISTAYDRVINANPEIGIALRNFYPNITNGDVLSYVLNPDQALNEINRKITAAEIGGAAVQAGLTTNESDAAYLARYGITKQQAEQGYRTISGYLPRAQQLSSIYGKQVEGGPYTQASAEREVFNVPGAAEEERKRQKITALEQAQFGGSSGLTQGALGRERAGQF